MRKAKIALIVLGLVAVVLVLYATTQAGHTREELIADVRQLAETIEAVHPDPYIRGGGKIAFQRRLQNTIRAIPEEGMNEREFYRLLSPLIASVGDAHTWLSDPYSYYPFNGIPLYFRTVERSLYVLGVPDGIDSNLIGSILVSIEGVPFAEILKRQRRQMAADNEYQLLRQCEGTGVLARRCFLENFLPEWQDKDRIRVTLESAAGSRQHHLLEVRGRMNSLTIPDSRIELPSRDRCDFVYSFLDADKQTALLVIDGMSSYREAFELWAAHGLENLHQRAGRVYRKYHDKSPPDDLSATIAGLPSATETFRSLVTEMKEAGSKSLIVDLRRNGGGNSLMSEILLYFLYGRELLLSTKGHSVEVRRYSDQYFRTYRQANLEEINADRDFPLTRADYDFQHDYYHNGYPGREQIAATFAATCAKMPTFAAEHQSGEYDGYYLPDNVIVLCSPRTFSSGYTLMRSLYRAGALLVGTPSAQAGNCFGDVLRFKLENSGLSFTVSHKYFEDFPDDAEKGHVLMPHHIMTYEILRSYDFDPNAEILYALDLIAN